MCHSGAIHCTVGNHLPRANGVSLTTTPLVPSIRISRKPAEKGQRKLIYSQDPLENNVGLVAGFLKWLLATTSCFVLDNFPGFCETPSSFVPC